MNTKDRGDDAEAYIAAALLEAGKAVLRPLGDNRRYDLVIEQGGRFLRVQCKTARWDSKTANALTFSTCSHYGHRGRPSRDYRGDIDFFAVFLPPLKTVYLVPVELGGR